MSKKNKNKNPNKNNKFSNKIAEQDVKIQNYLTSFYLMLVIVVFVLGFHDAFYDIAQTKRGIFITFTFAYLFFMLFASLFELKAIADYKINIIDICLGLYIVSLLISVLLSSDRSQSFWGTEDKCTGMIIYLLGALAIFFISKYLSWNVGLTWCYLGTCCAVYLLQVFNRFNVDPLNMYEVISPEQKAVYLSTLGHCNYNASFNCITLCMVMVFFFLCEKPLSRVVYGITLLLGFMGSICCCADSVYLGLAVGFIFLFGYSILHSDKLWMLVAEILLFAMSNLIVLLIYKSEPEDVLFWGASTILLSMPVVILEVAFGIVLTIVVLIDMKTGFINKICKVLIKIYSAIVGVGLLGSIIYVIANFSDEFGSYRGYIWRHIIKMFGRSSFLHKLFGYGFNNLVKDLKTVVGIDSIPDGTTIADAHNVYLNTLITSGIFGSIILAILVGAVLVKAYKNRSVSPERSLFILVGMSAFLVQGLVNGPQIITTPIILVEMGIFINLCKEKSSDI